MTSFTGIDLVGGYQNLIAHPESCDGAPMCFDNDDANENTQTEGFAKVSGMRTDTVLYSMTVPETTLQNIFVQTARHPVSISKCSRVVKIFSRIP